MVTPRKTMPVPTMSSKRYTQQDYSNQKSSNAKSYKRSHSTTTFEKQAFNKRQSINIKQFYSGQEYYKAIYTEDNFEMFKALIEKEGLHTLL